ncbi:hypothetical protein PV518_17755 [Streptomyces sp. ND04-05B]|uniref:hypothetical protein n=1 Tax=Streptomyces sp. ND04-05B TaxID=3028693 RepID=UPI0029AB3B92|nr:hypothetical protein [Streptomyces sp. ND04-05B]MDX3064006.1 hypothetical protein [Streptomyces sp. ND04-05B]
MSIVAERVARRVRVGLVEEVERQIREDDARGPEQEPVVVVTRTVLPVGPAWETTVLAEGPTVLPSGFIPAHGQDDACGICGFWSCRCLARQVGADELRVRGLMIAAMTRFGWGRSR